MKKNQLVLTALAVMIAVAGYLTYAGKNTDSIYTASDNQSNDIMLDISDEDILSENIALEQAQALDTAEETQQANGTVMNQESTQLQANAESSEQNELESKEPGDTILTNADEIASFIAQVELNREKTRASSKESLNAIIENDTIDEEQKQEAINDLVHMTEITQIEDEIEDLLSAKGLDNVVVTIGDNNVDVVVGATEITDMEKTQIEDVVKRKADVSADKIVISLMSEK